MLRWDPTETPGVPGWSWPGSAGADWLKCMHDGQTENSTSARFYSSFWEHSKVIFCFKSAARSSRPLARRVDDWKMFYTGRVQYTNVGWGTFDPVSPVAPSAVRKNIYLHVLSPALLLPVDRKHIETWKRAAPVQRQRFHLHPPPIPKT